MSFRFGNWLPGSGTRELNNKIDLSIPNQQELETMSSEDLRQELAKSLTITAKVLGYLALVWRELEKRGEDLSDLRVGLSAHLPLIAAGHLDPEVVVRFAGQPGLLKSVATLPLNVQHAMASGKPVTVLVANEKGELEPVELPASALTPKQVKLVFDTGRIRSLDEQRAFIESTRLSQLTRSRPGGVGGRVRYDPKTDTIRIGHSKATVGEVLQVILQIGATPTNDELNKIVNTKLTDDEHRGVVIRATQAGMTMQDFVRSLLVSRALL